MTGAETVLVAMLAGALRVSTPFLFVSLGECLTERAGRINLGNEGVLVLGAMVAYAASYLTGSPWLGVLAAAGAGALLGGLHGLLCGLTRVNDVAMGIAILMAGDGIAFFFGKPYVQPSAPGLSGIPFGAWSSVPQMQSALTISPLFLLGVAAAFGMAWMFVLPHPKMLPRRRELSQPNAPWFLSPLAAAKPSRVTDDACSDVPVSAVADPPAGAGRRVR